ncbi:MAG: TIGR00730 family Rossman fold protein [Betaproteobacteria bacterium]|nr:TIGR00730 family Rossman fold protein [Betaproteobacteria bacterium]
MQRLCVYCGSAAGHDAVYAKAARELGLAIAQRGMSLVYGGGHVGLMGIVADAALAAGAKVTGVIPTALMDSEVGHTQLTELRVVKDMHERKALMAELADGFVALPGGIGTLEELFEVITWLQLGYHRKPVGLLNTQGFYDDLLRMLNKQRDTGFLKPAHHALLITEADTAALLDRLMAFEMPEGVSVFSRRGASTLGP